MTTTVTIHAAKTNLSKLIELARSGEKVVILRNKEPVAELVPVAKPHARRGYGSMKGLVTIHNDFFEPLPDEELDAWEGKN